MMKKIVVSFFVLIVTVSCNQFDNLTRFDLTYETEVTIPGGGGLNLPFNVNTPPVQTNNQGTFENNNTRKDLIEEVYLKCITMEITAPEEGNFQFLEEVTIYISSPNVPEVEAAYKIPVPENASKKISLDVTSKNLKDYLIADEFNLRANTTTDEVVSDDHKITITTVFEVKAELFK